MKKEICCINTIQILNVMYHINTTLQEEFATLKPNSCHNLKSEVGSSGPD